MPDPIFCPYCGTRSVDAGPQRTYCTTCGEDIATPGQIEDLEKALNQTEHDRDGWQDDCEKAQHERDKALAEIDMLKGAKPL